MPLQVLPKEITALPVFPDGPREIYAFFVGGDQAEEMALVVWNGSGFGHWGIVICPSDKGKKALESLKGTLVPWGDGVYFYKDW